MVLARHPLPRTFPSPLGKEVAQENAQAVSGINATPPSDEKLFRHAALHSVHRAPGGPRDNARAVGREVQVGLLRSGLEWAGQRAGSCCCRPTPPSSCSSGSQRAFLRGSCGTGKQGLVALTQTPRKDRLRCPPAPAVLLCFSFPRFCLSGQAPALGGLRA